MFPVWDLILWCSQEPTLPLEHHIHTSWTEVFQKVLLVHLSSLLSWGWVLPLGSSNLVLAEGADQRTQQKHFRWTTETLWPIQGQSYFYFKPHWDSWSEVIKLVKSHVPILSWQIPEGKEEFWNKFMFKCFASVKLQKKIALGGGN